ncbi:MAG TPA: hypothetical protein VLT58_08025, partial [Polyangia bacterium]|nr:hypothetical protein [Polyangia bacterium]
TVKATGSIAVTTPPDAVAVDAHPATDAPPASDAQAADAHPGSDGGPLLDARVDAPVRDATVIDAGGQS